MDLETFQKAAEIVTQIRDEEQKVRFFAQYSLVGLKLYNDEGQTIVLNDEQRSDVIKWLAKAKLNHQKEISGLNSRLESL